jgi:hypothetical protein
MRTTKMPTPAVMSVALQKQSLRLKNARLMSVHEVHTRLILSKRVPLGRLQKLLLRLRTVCLVQPVPNM